MLPQCKSKSESPSIRYTERTEVSMEFTEKARKIYWLNPIRSVPSSPSSVFSVTKIRLMMTIRDLSAVHARQKRVHFRLTTRGLFPQAHYFFLRPPSKASISSTSGAPARAFSWLHSNRPKSPLYSQLPQATPFFSSVAMRSR